MIPPKGGTVYLLPLENSAENILCAFFVSTRSMRFQIASLLIRPLPVATHASVPQTEIARR